MHTKDMYNYYNYDINDIKRRGTDQDSIVIMSLSTLLLSLLKYLK
jgi:hypothetical protein